MARVLIVDDEEPMRDAVRMVLEQEMHTVQEAGDGETALELLEAGHFDAVLLDIQMPGLDGLQTLARIREKNKTLPVIMVTGYGSVDSAVRVMEMGASHYLSKPFKNQVLLDALHKVVPSSQPSSAEESMDPPDVRRTPVVWRPLPVAAGDDGKKWTGVLLVTLLTFGAAGAGVWHFMKPPPPKAAPVAAPRVDDFTLPYKNPTNILWRGDRLWVLDWFAQALYVHQLKDGELKIEHVYHLPSKHVTGFAFIGDMLYTCDSWTRKIEKRKLDEFLTVIASFPAPGKAPAALFWDGKYFWCTDAMEGKIYQLEPAQRLVKIAAYDAPAKAISGFYKDANFAWTADMQTRKIYQHRLDNRLTVIATYANEDFERGPEPLSSIYWLGSDLWFARDRQSAIRRRALAQLKRAEITTSIR